MGNMVYDMRVEMIDGLAQHTFWYEIDDDNSDDSNPRVRVIRLADIDGTLSGDIL